MMLILLMILLSAGISYARLGDSPARSTGDVSFWMDEASFSAEGKVYQEFYLQIPASGLEFRELDGQLIAQYEVEAVLLDKRGKRTDIQDRHGNASKRMAWNRKIELAIGVDYTDAIANETVGIFALPGDYTAHLKVKDVFSEAAGECHMELVAPEFKGTGLSLSDLQFARQISHAEGGLTSAKGGNRVVSNASRTVTDSLHVYFEIYGLSDAGSTGVFALALTLYDSTGVRVRELLSARYRKPGSTCSMAKTFDTSALPGGRYVLKAEVLDNDTGVSVVRARPFTCGPMPAPPALAIDRLSLNRYHDQIRYIASSSELDSYKRLNPEDKAAFIIQFWRDRDPTPNTLENEFALEHFRRIAHSDASFPSRPRQPGSGTDMGRVYIKYGPPDDIERSFFGGVGMPFEIWTYLMHRYEFVFVDMRNEGVYELAHSTVPNERYNPEWRVAQRIHGQPDPTVRPSAESP